MYSGINGWAYKSFAGYGYQQEWGKDSMIDCCEMRVCRFRFSNYFSPGPVFQATKTLRIFSSDFFLILPRDDGLGS